MCRSGSFGGSGGELREVANLAEKICFCCRVRGGHASKCLIGGADAPTNDNNGARYVARLSAWTKSDGHSLHEDHRLFRNGHCSLPTIGSEGCRATTWVSLACSVLIFLGRSAGRHVFEAEIPLIR